MENNRIEQIRMVIKLFFSDYDMQDIYDYIESNVTLNEIKIISEQNKDRLSVKERLKFSFVMDVPLEQQIQNFQNKSDDYIDVIDNILDCRREAIEIFNNGSSTEEDLLNICARLFLNDLNDKQITLFKESIIGIAINSGTDEEYNNMFLLLYDNLYNKYFSVRSGRLKDKVVYTKTPDMLIAAAFYEANGNILESLDGDIVYYMKLLGELEPETTFIKGLFEWLGFKKKVILMELS